MMKHIDLSHPISNTMSTYPSDPEVSIITKKEISADNSLLHCFSMGTHTGTHLDVPAHIIDGGKKLNDFSLDSFAGRIVRVDKKTYTMLGKITEKIDGVIYDTGWYKHFNNADIYYRSDRPLIPFELIDELKNMGMKIFGCDLPSVDKSGSSEKPIHNALLGSDIIIYESLANLNQLPLLIPFDFYGFPLPFVGLDGSPVRAVGIL